MGIKSAGQLQRAWRQALSKVQGAQGIGRGVGGKIRVAGIVRYYSQEPIILISNQDKNGTAFPGFPQEISYAKILSIGNIIRNFRSPIDSQGRPDYLHFWTRFKILTLASS